MLAFFCLGAAVFLSGCEQNNDTLRFSGPSMGTQYHVTVVPDETLTCDYDQMDLAIRETLAATNAQMSHYDQDSELSRLSRAPTTEWLDLSPEMADILSLSESIYQASDGSFDVTLGPLVNLWGFGPKSSPDDQVPSDEAIEKAKALTGGGSLTLKGRSLKKSKMVDLNLSAIAKGYGADQIGKALSNCGARNYLAELGGEMRLQGLSHRGTPWKIAVEKPGSSLAGGSVQRLLEVSDRGVATSGDYRNYFEQNGVRYSHTIDPRTGRPITHTLASVTVLAPSSAEADAWATAISVLGPEPGMAAAEAEGLAVYMLIKTTTGFKEQHSKAFATYVQ